MVDIDLMGEEWTPIGFVSMSTRLEYSFRGIYD